MNKLEKSPKIKDFSRVFTGVTYTSAKKTKRIYKVKYYRRQITTVLQT